MKKALAGLLIALSALPACGQTGGLADALMRDVAWLADDAREGRKTGTRGGRAAADYLRARLEEVDLAPLGPSYDHPFVLRRSAGDSLVGINLAGRIAGTRSGAGIIVLTAHYDHLGIRNGSIYNGADDNASGVAAALALLPRLRDVPLDHDLVVVFLDAEEMGLRGARAIVEDPPFALENVVLTINLDMVGRSESRELWAAGARHYPALGPVLRAVEPVGDLKLRLGHDGGAEGDQDWTHASDHAAFHAKGIPFVYFGVEDHEDYHGPGDDSERIDSSFLEAATLTVERALRALDRAIDN